MPWLHLFMGSWQGQFLRICKPGNGAIACLEIGVNLTYRVSLFTHTRTHTHTHTHAHTSEADAQSLWSKEWEDDSNYLGEGAQISRNWTTVQFLVFYAWPQNGHGVGGCVI